MSDIHIERSHALGLTHARELAQRWSDEAAQKLDMAVTVVRGDASDTIEFNRSGVKGSLRVEAAQLTLDAKLGLMLRPFQKKIEAEIESNLDDLLAAAGSSAGQNRHFSDSTRSM